MAESAGGWSQQHKMCTVQSNIRNQNGEEEQAPQSQILIRTGAMNQIPLRIWTSKERSRQTWKIIMISLFPFFGYCINSISNE